MVNGCFSRKSRKSGNERKFLGAVAAFLASLHHRPIVPQCETDRVCEGVGRRKSRDCSDSDRCVASELRLSGFNLSTHPVGKRGGTNPLGGYPRPTPYKLLL